jgi:hypothetical protein
VVLLNKKTLFCVRYAEPDRRQNRQKGAKPMFTTPTHPGAMTPAQLAQRAAERLTQAAAALVLTAAIIATLAALILTF